MDAPLAKTASGKLNMRQRRSTRTAAGAQSKSVKEGASGRAKGISGGIGLDVPYEWGK